MLNRTQEEIEMTSEFIYDTPLWRVRRLARMSESRRMRLGGVVGRRPNTSSPRPEKGEAP